MLPLPRSPSRTEPSSVSRMFAALTSRWIRPDWCRYASAASTSCATTAISASLRGALKTSITSVTEPRASSMARQMVISCR